MLNLQLPLAILVVTVTAKVLSADQTYLLVHPSSLNWKNATNVTLIPVSNVTNSSYLYRPSAPVAVPVAPVQQARPPPAGFVQYPPMPQPAVVPAPFPQPAVAPASFPQPAPVQPIGFINLPRPAEVPTTPSNDRMHTFGSRSPGDELALQTTIHKEASWFGTTDKTVKFRQSGKQKPCMVTQVSVQCKNYNGCASAKILNGEGPGRYRATVRVKSQDGKGIDAEVKVFCTRSK